MSPSVRVPFSQLPLVKRNAINQARLKKAATPAEQYFLNCLASLGVPYRFQQGFYTPYHRIVDFYLPDHNLIVEIDGPCHDPERDMRRDRWFEAVRRIKIVRLTNEQVLSGEFENLYGILYDRPGKRQFNQFRSNMKSVTCMESAPSTVPSPAQLMRRFTTR